MTSSQKCKIARGLDKTGKIAGPLIVVSIIITGIALLAANAILAYQANHSDFYRGAAGLFFVIVAWIVLVAIGVHIEAFVKKYRNIGC